MEAAKRLRESYPLRRQVYATMIGLMAATGLRISEALNLCLHDVLPDGILQIRVPSLEEPSGPPTPTTVTALDSYLENRRRLAVTDDHVFLSAGNQRIHIPWRSTLSPAFASSPAFPSPNHDARAFMI